MSRRLQLRAMIVLNALAIAKTERLLKSRETRMHNQSAGSVAENDAQMAYRQASYNLQQRKAKQDRYWAEYDSLPVELRSALLDYAYTSGDRDENGETDVERARRLDDEQGGESDVEDDGPPDYGPPGSGAVVTEYSGFEPGLE